MTTAYLSSKIGSKYKKRNDKDCELLENYGITPLAPHRLSIRKHWSSSEHCYELMRRADVCLVHFPIGVDCATELGWFIAKNIPIYYLGKPAKKDWMYKPFIKPITELDEVL